MDNRMMCYDSDSLYAASSDVQTLKMTWKIGQKVACDRYKKQAADCYIHTIDLRESVTIFCPMTNTIVCGQRQNLERLGWRVVL
ncbi:MAG: hypothetical protein RBJ76_04415 [Stenomitos frigidus ULC029]